MTEQIESEMDGFCSRHWTLLLVLLLVFSALVSGYGTWLNYFYDIDEPKYARAAYEMVAHGNFLAPMFDGMPRMEKPPLVYWTMFPFAWLASHVDLGASGLFLMRMPTVICSMLMVLGTVMIGRRLFGPATGLLSGAVLQSSVLFKFMAVMIKVDVVFACCVTWASYFYLLYYLGERSRRTALGGAVLTALGVLAKGPFAFLPLAGLVLAEGIRFNVGKMHESGKMVTFLSSLGPRGVFAAAWKDRGILLLWFAAGCIPFFLWLWGAWLTSGFDYTAGLIGQFFLNTSTSESKAIAKFARLDPYFDTLTVIFFPWGGYVFGTVYAVWKSLRERFNEKYVFLACSFLVYLLVFTLLFKLKSNRYMLPVLPLLSVMICDWLMNASRDKSYKTMFEMGFIWLCSMAAMLGYRSFRSGNVSVNLADGVPVGQYMDLMLPFFIALGIFFLVLLFASIKQHEFPALHIVLGALAIAAVMPFYYNALPSYASVADSRPLPIMGQSVTDRMKPFANSDTLVIHRPFFIKTYPDVVYFLKKLDAGAKCMYSLGSEAPPEQILQAMVKPSMAAELFRREHNDAERFPAYEYFSRTEFRNAVLLLTSDDYAGFLKLFRALPQRVRSIIKIDEFDVLTVKWVKQRVYIVRINPEKI
ncbi:glycosyltransferase family 39 protein [Maridesulfovibrio sp.]|uniref:ArnT family glycosyltransferase n=1 Tax=Maridesulfovibrio sp. TaxID=2795000 RepID=UPI002A18E650|nr:glycosyltransferase family 39 protein [Maridesulfovibrio sp.]